MFCKTKDRHEFPRTKDSEDIALMERQQPVDNRQFAVGKKIDDLGITIYEQRTRSVFIMLIRA
ncbi:MAG: hypothetical protein GQ468_03640 [Candidatus Scalindua sp.]|nr:hypothetical protein [Candidatus Scalindua sp.]